jgi:hypothetical protein
MILNTLALRYEELELQELKDHLIVLRNRLLDRANRTKQEQSKRKGIDGLEESNLGEEAPNQNWKTHWRLEDDVLGGRMQEDIERRIAIHKIWSTEHSYVAGLHGLRGEEPWKVIQPDEKTLEMVEDLLVKADELEFIHEPLLQSLKY